MADELDDNRRKALSPTDAPQPFRQTGRVPHLTALTPRRREGRRIRAGAWGLPECVQLRSASPLTRENDIRQLEAVIESGAAMRPTEPPERKADVNGVRLSGGRADIVRKLRNVRL